ncbi:hypothetical protein BGZ46_003397 [Entomortierella lignicola]|nr:hypothetical protein BGZ46_003397 [Entomortierella lignicola]
MRSRSLPSTSADAATPRNDHINRPLQQQQRPSQEIDEENNVFISSASSAPSRRIQTQSKRPSSSDVIPSTAAPQLQDYLMQAAHCAQGLQDRNQELEDENRKLRELVRQHRTSALDWCSVAKQYQQDRNFMTLRLAELELQLSNTTYKNNKDTTETHNQTVGSSKDKTTATTTTPNRQDDNEDDSLSNFVSQSISQILDYMAPSSGSKEPKLPPLSKGGYSTSGNAINKEGAPTEPILRSALKTSSKSRPCTCGCQEELKAWKARCDFAENQATLLEMRCEKTNVMVDAYKAKWTQWKETVVREQYQRRMKAAMSPQSAQYLSLSSKQNPQQETQLNQQEQQGNRRMVHSVSDPTRRSRSATQESNSSHKRQEVTKRNTLFNQLISRAAEDSNVIQGATSTNRDFQAETSPVSSPHVAFVHKDGDSSSSDEVTERQARQKSKTHVLDSEENDTSVEYGEQPMSLTFPSDLALHRRGYGLSELEEEDDDDDVLASHGEDRDVRTQGRNRKYIDDSPTTRVSERYQKRSTAIPRHQPHISSTIDTSKTEHEHEHGAALLSIVSDQSSPPMFDSEDYVTSYRSAKTPIRQSSIDKSYQGTTTITPKVTPKNTQLDLSAGAPHRGRVIVPETPLELQGITPKKENQPLALSVVKTTSAHSDTAQRTLMNRKNLPDMAREASIGDVEVALQHSAGPQSPSGADDPDEPDKENKAPQVIEIHSNSDLDLHDKEVSFVEDSICHEQNDEVSHDQESENQTTTAVLEQRIYNFTERRKDKRKQMHGHDCACCRRFYELTGPLPLPDGYNTFFTPAPRPGEKEVWERTPEERLQDRIQQISRHRVQHEQPLTPPGFWDTDFPSTQDRLEWDKIAGERREMKKQRKEHQKLQQQQQKRRR